MEFAEQSNLLGDAWLVGDPPTGDAGFVEHAAGCWCQIRLFFTSKYAPPEGNCIANGN